MRYKILNWKQAAKAWADGFPIQFRHYSGLWEDSKNNGSTKSSFFEEIPYRIKPSSHKTVKVATLRRAILVGSYRQWKRSKKKGKK